MIHLNMTVEIDVCADDKWGTSIHWVKNDIMRKIENAVGDMFEYPLSVHAELEDYNVDGDDAESEDKE